VRCGILAEIQKGDPLLDLVTGTGNSAATYSRYASAWISRDRSSMHSSSRRQSPSAVESSTGTDELIGEKRHEPARASGRCHGLTRRRVRLPRYMQGVSAGPKV
jgi:hypothetical protein